MLSVDKNGANPLTAKANPAPVFLNKRLNSNFASLDANAGLKIAAAGGLEKREASLKSVTRYASQDHFRSSSEILSASNQAPLNAKKRNFLSASKASGHEPRTEKPSIRRLNPDLTAEKRSALLSAGSVHGRRYDGASSHH